MNKLPFASIVVCTYNGEKKIEDCLRSLVSQNYPKDRFEIIVVDDGSSDETYKVVSKYPVRVVRHKKNLGICSARNSGLKSAKGEIIAYTDDDCIADKDWLISLVRLYKKDVIAVGGMTKPYRSQTLMEKYMSEIGYGNPAPLEFGKSDNPIFRFLVYYKDMIRPVTSIPKRSLQVRSIYTLNASFKTSILKEVGGWIEGLDFREDTEICDRFNKFYKTKKVLFARNAVIYHKHRTSYFQFLKQTFYRSKSTLKLYTIYKKIPPIFPFPILIIFLSLLVGAVNVLDGLLALLILPQILYVWWLLKFLKKLKFYYLLFAYMQFSLELATILGMARGLIIFNSDKK